MSTSLNLLKAYDSDAESDTNDHETNTNESSTNSDAAPAAASSSSDKHEEFKFTKIDPSLSLVSSITVDAAPLIPYTVTDLKKYE